MAASTRLQPVYSRHSAQQQSTPDFLVLQNQTGVLSTLISLSTLLVLRLQASLCESAMGQNKVCTSNTYGYPEASQSAVKVKSKVQQAASGATKSGQNGGNTKDKKDVWGPIYQNRQHFIDMHIC
ncbi:uncharacterized protein LOC135091698 [Scylla paramamosain]